MTELNVAQAPGVLASSRISPARTPGTTGPSRKAWRWSRRPPPIWTGAGRTTSKRLLARRRPGLCRRDHAPDHAPDAGGLVAAWCSARVRGRRDGPEAACDDRYRLSLGTSGEAEPPGRGPALRPGQPAAARPSASKRARPRTWTSACMWKPPAAEDQPLARSGPLGPPESAFRRGLGSRLGPSLNRGKDTKHETVRRGQVITGAVLSLCPPCRLAAPRDGCALYPPHRGASIPKRKTPA